MIAKEIQNELGLYTLRSMGRPYDVQIRSGAISQLSVYLDDIGVGLGDSLVVVFDTNTQLHYGKLIQEHLEQGNRPVKIVVLPHGEENKTLESIKVLWEAFIQAGMDRKSVVIAVGGGVTSDLVGFAASTYMRGCRWVCLPTTLLSMVDASIGGKTGFDLPQGKNLIGSFYPPELVLIDPEMLKTLPKDEFISGMAEVVKHGIIADSALFEDCSLGLDHINANLTDIIKRAVRVKVDVIEEDPYEKGKRASLNLGHTIGHAVEIESEFKLKHGEAIAIGIVAESRLAEKMGLAELGLTEKIIAVFETLKLPTSLPMEMNRPRIIGFMKNDKKKSGNAVHFALPIKIGTVRTGIAIGNLEETL
jgi:3-dehydroquinate synthase